VASDDYLSRLQAEADAAGEAARKATLSSAISVNPDQYTTQRGIAQRMGVAPAVVETMPDEMAQRDRLRQIEHDTVRAPQLRMRFADADFAKLAHDDAPVLSKVEQAVGNMTRYFMGAGESNPVSDLADTARYLVSAPGTTRGLAGDAVDAGKTVGLGATVGVGKAIFDVAAVLDDFVGWDSGAAGMRERAKRAGEAMDYFGMDAEGSTGKAIKSGLQSAGTNLAMLPLGLARGLYTTASQAATTVAGLMGLSAGAGAYNEAREAGKGKLASAAFGIPQGVFEFVFEKIPAHKLFGDLAANAGLWRTLKHQAFSETWTEQMTTLAQDFNEWMNMHPEKTLAEFLAERPEAAYQTLVATLVGVGVQTSTIHGINKAIEKATDQSLQFKQDAFEQLQKLAAQSALRERSPEQFRALIQQTVDASDSAQKSIHVDAQVLNQLGPEILAQLPEQVRAQIPAEAMKNGTVEIPMADVLTVAPGTPLEQILNDHARMTPESMSRADAQAAGDQSQVLRQEAEKVIQQAQDQQAAQAEYDQVQQMYAQQIAASGRYRPAVAEQMGHWLASFYTAYGSRTGMTATQMQARYPVRVLGVAPTIAGDDTLHDGSMPGAITVDGYHFSAAARPTLSTGFYGTGLKGSARDEILNHPDKRLSKRLSFYFDKGTGVRPESGVGGVAHRARLSNVYDADADPLKLRSGDARAFEAKLLDLGYSGYANRMEGTQPGQVVMLGDQTITPEVLGPLSKIDTGEKVPALERKEAPWQVQHTGTPEQLQPRLDKMRANPAWAGYEARIVGDRLEVRKTGPVFEQRVKTMTPAIRKLLKSLTPEEQAKVTGLVAEKILSVMQDLPSSKEMAAVAYAGRAKRGWYKNSADAISTVFGADAPRFAALLAAMSPQTSVENNLFNALATWKNWVEAGRPTTKAEIVAVMGRSVMGSKLTDSVLPAWINNSVRALTDADPGKLTLSGPKVHSFMRNLVGVVDEVTNDAWMANYALVDQKIFAGGLNAAGTDPGKGKGYLAMSARVREAAATLTKLTGETWTPAEVQETIWSWAKTLYETAESAGETRTARQIVEERALSDEAINATPDFNTLFSNPTYAKILEDAGYGTQLEELARRSDAAAGQPRTGGEAAPFAAEDQLRLELQAARRLERLADARGDASAAAREQRRDQELDDVYGQDGNRSGRQAGAGPAPLPGAPVIDGATGPDPRIVAVAEQYARDNGIDLRRQGAYVQVDEARAARIAQAYAEMQHAPQDPAVQEAYADLIRQTMAQYMALQQAGYKFWFIDPTADPYKSPWDAMRDLRANQSMGVFPTDAGFGSSEADVSGNPLLADTGLEWPDQHGTMRPVLANDLFRAVHDAFGHGLEGAGFRAQGEENAWQAHVRLFTGPAIGAITSETRGQNSWLNYGPHGEANRTAKVEDTVFADQKTGLMPSWTWTEGRAADATQDTFNQEALLLAPNGKPSKLTPRQYAHVRTPEFKAWFGDWENPNTKHGEVSFAVDRETGEPLVVYHGSANAGFEEFATPGGKQRGDLAIFLTDNKHMAASYTRRGRMRDVTREDVGPEDTVDAFGGRYGLFVNIRNPEIADFRGANWDGNFFGDQFEVYDEDGELAYTEDGGSVMGRDEARALAKKLGGTFEPASPLGQTTDSVVRSASSASTARFDGAIIYDVVDDGGGPSPYAGEPSTVFAVFDPNQVKSADFNDGGYRSGDARIHRQGARGTFNPATLDLVLNPNANLSTFFHETGHFFLEVMADIASQPGAPTQIVEDMNTFLKWAGVSDLATWNGLDLEGKRAAHERWAESIEQYVMEGKAPSLELQPLMRRFATWLKSVYGSIKQFLAARGQAASGPVLGQADDNAFKRWFGGSKVVDENGEPLVVYHGTGKKFAAFDIGRESKNFGTFGEFTVSRLGAFFAADKKFAARFKPKGGKLVQAFLSLQNPVNLVEGYPSEVWEKLGPVLKENNLLNIPADGMWELFDKGFPGGVEFVQALKDAGYDGAKIGERDADGNLREVYVAFKPEQIKSAAGNDGTFDANDPSILSQDPNAQPGPQMALNDDIRRVMDRMLATDEQIAQANEVAGLLPNEEADAIAAERLNKRSMGDLKWAVRAKDAVIAKLRKQARAIEKGIRAEVTAEVNQMREVQAKDMLAKSQKENGGKLNDTERAIIADAFGYESVDQMLQAIDAFGSRRDAIDGMTQQRMLQEHGDLTDEDAIRQAALEAVHNEARARSLATELRTQREMLNPRQDTGEVNAKGSKITVNALVEAAKQFAANVVARTPLRDLKSKAWQHTAAERRAGQRWQEATAAGKTQEAVQAKQDQMLNNAAAKAALDARQEMGKILEFFKRVVKGNDEKVVEKGRDPDVVNAARAVLGAYGIETPASKGAAAYLETLQRNDPDLHAVIAPMVEAATRNAQPIEALTFEELQALHEEIAAMWHLAKSSRQMEVDGDKMDIEDAAAEVRARMETIGIPNEIPGETGALTKKDERVRWLQFAGALLRRVEQWAEGMDGKFGGPFLRYIYQPVKEAANRYRTDKVEYRKKFQALVDAVAPTMTHQLIAAPELGYTFGRGHNGIGHAELLHALLHTGNESNKRKLLLGRNWAVEGPDGQLDTSKWDAFIARLVNEGVLQPAHYNFAQGVWDLLEETKPLAQKAHRDVFGRYFAEVTADPFTDPWGQARRGGYVPAQADPNIVTDERISKAITKENESMLNSFPTTNKGFTKARVEYNRPLKLDLRTIPQHIDKVLLFSHMEPAARGVTRLLDSPTVSQALNRIDPSAVKGMLTPWLQRAAKQIVETPIMGDGRTSRVLSALRSRAGAALMFANVSNSIQQVSGFVSAFSKLKSDGMSSHMMQAAAQLIAHPKEMKAAVAGKSIYMATRMDGEIAAMTDAMNDILLKPSLYEKSQSWAMRHSYFLQSALDNTTGPIIWTAAYNGALEKGHADAEAVRYADSVIRQTQGANSAEDVSRIETGPAYARVFTQFIGYFNMLANTNATALKQIAGEMGLKKGAGKALGVVFFGVLAPIWVAEAIAQAFKGGPDDKDHDGYLDDWLAAVFGMGTIKGLLAQVPFIAQVGQVVVNRFNTNPADDRFSLSPAVSLLESAASVPYDIYKQIVDGAHMQKLVRDSAALVSLATGLPAAAVARPVGYAAGIADNKINPTGPVDAARGAITGTASPESKVK